MSQILNKLAAKIGLLRMSPEPAQSYGFQHFINVLQVLFERLGEDDHIINISPGKLPTTLLTQLKLYALLKEGCSIFEPKG
jgi:hypothetical protein